MLQRLLPIPRGVEVGVAIPVGCMVTQPIIAAGAGQCRRADRQSVAAWNRVA
jgi:hypothetical protein